ncbi:dienelactone hydrolase family protein [Rhodobacterales bacterium HKCCSP123]|nr:dienelactone hydrolase family protein [Rhodobacterales bacterium HKCCSP123]
MRGYFADGGDAAATVVILPTWNGMSDYEMDRARMLSEMGYDAFAADLHGVDARPRILEEKQAAYQAFFGDPDRLLRIVQAAVETAGRLGDGDVIVMGYSMGGGAAMELSRSGRGAELGIAGYAVFSGRVSDPAGRLMPEGTAPIFVAHGSADTMVSASALPAFAEELDMMGVPHRIEILEGAGHLFSAFGFPNYDAEADERSWTAFTEFLADAGP